MLASNSDTHKPHKMSKTSSIREYYEFDQGVKWKCVLCGKILNGVNSSNLKQHIKSKHNAEYQNYIKNNPVGMSPRKRSSHFQDDKEPGIPKPPKEPRLEPQKSKKSEIAPMSLALSETDGEDSNAVAQLSDREECADVPKPDPPQLPASNGALSMFFQTMFETIKDMPPELILEVKRKVFMAVSEAEQRMALMTQ